VQIDGRWDTRGSVRGGTRSGGVACRTWSGLLPAVGEVVVVVVFAAESEAALVSVVAFELRGDDTFLRDRITPTFFRGLEGSSGCGNHGEALLDSLRGELSRVRRPGVADQVSLQGAGCDGGVATRRLRCQQGETVALKCERYLCLT